MRFSAPLSALLTIAVSHAALPSLARRVLADGTSVPFIGVWDVLAEKKLGLGTIHLCPLVIWCIECLWYRVPDDTVTLEEVIPRFRPLLHMVQWR